MIWYRQGERESERESERERKIGGRGVKGVGWMNGQQKWKLNVCLYVRMHAVM